MEWSWHPASMAVSQSPAKRKRTTDHLSYSPVSSEYDSVVGVGDSILELQQHNSRERCLQVL